MLKAFKNILENSTKLNNFNDDWFDNEKNDIWSLGCTFLCFYLLRKSPPFFNE